MFARFKAKRARKRYVAELAAWQSHRDAQAQLLTIARTFTGEDSTAVLLKPGEKAFATVTGVSLVEDRRGPGTYVGGSRGVSIPLGSVAGHSVRYRVGTTRGHYQQAQPTPTAIDVGTMIITDRRVVFEGGRQTRECLFDKLVGFHHLPAGATVLSVSNRQKPTTLQYGPRIAPWVDFRLDLALAHYRGNVAELVAALSKDLAAVDAAMPPPPGPDVPER